jgi:hypothetical protein
MPRIVDYCLTKMLTVRSHVLIVYNQMRKHMPNYKTKHLTMHLTTDICTINLPDYLITIIRPALSPPICSAKAFNYFIKVIRSIIRLITRPNVSICSIIRLNIRPIVRFTIRLAKTPGYIIKISHSTTRSILRSNSSLRTTPLKYSLVTCKNKVYSINNLLTFSRKTAEGSATLVWSKIAVTQPTTQDCSKVSHSLPHHL